MHLLVASFKLYIVVVIPASVESLLKGLRHRDEKGESLDGRHFEIGNGIGNQKTIQGNSLLAKFNVYR